MILQNGILQSDLLKDLPVVHGFTTRQWGNLGFGKKQGDPEVVRNRTTLFESLGLSSRTLVQPRQVHSSHVVSHLEYRPGCEADATYGNSPDTLHSVLTADCVPMLLYHPSGIVAAVHAGWRGLIGGIIPNTLRLLPPNLTALIGPAIGPCCYEVGEDLADNFERAFGSEVIDRSFPKPHLDLIHVALLQLQEERIEEIDAAHLCTACHPDLFFSYRRDGSSGRQMSFISLTADNTAASPGPLAG